MGYRIDTYREDHLDWQLGCDIHPETPKETVAKVAENIFNALGTAVRIVWTQPGSSEPEQVIIQFGEQNVVGNEALHKMW